MHGQEVSQIYSVSRTPEIINIERAGFGFWPHIMIKLKPLYYEPGELVIQPNRLDLESYFTFGQYPEDSPFSIGEIKKPFNNLSDILDKISKQNIKATFKPIPIPKKYTEAVVIAHSTYRAYCPVAEHTPMNAPDNYIYSPINSIDVVSFESWCPNSSTINIDAMPGSMNPFFKLVKVFAGEYEEFEKSLELSKDHRFNTFDVSLEWVDKFKNK